MSKKPEPPASEDARLFREAMQGVAPLAPSDRHPPPPPPRKFPAPLQSNHVPPDGLSDHAADDVPLNEFLRPGMDRMALRKLRRGHWPVQDSLDLHGSTSDEARRLLVAFLDAACSRGLRCISIIHGKGWRKHGGEGILKLRARGWLAQHPAVLAFCEPPQSSGGGGAVWVLLRLPAGR